MAPHLARLTPLLPGLALASGVTLAAMAAEGALKGLSGGRVALPGMVLALIIGISLYAFAHHPRFEAGLTYAVKTLLRYAIALLGLRIALGDILALGFSTVLLVIGAMATTLISGLWLARLVGREAGFGALAGAANAVCGASATLAAATVVPDYKGKSADIAFTVVMANAMSTLVMLAYPPLCAALGLDARETGVLLGLTIHDMAQVVGAGYAVSEDVGNNAVIVKLFRVFLLLPAVLAIGWYFARQAKAGVKQAKVPVPGFALVFLLLCVVNTIAPLSPLAEVYVPVKSVLSTASTFMMMTAIAALGLGTSLGAILSLGWRHMAVFMGATGIILLFTLSGIFILR